MHGKWKHAEHYILRYENCKNNNNKDFRSYPEMTVQVVLRKFHGGIYVLTHLEDFNVGRFGQVSLNNSLLCNVYSVETTINLRQNLYRVNWM